MIGLMDVETLRPLLECPCGELALGLHSERNGRPMLHLGLGTFLASCGSRNRMFLMAVYLWRIAGWIPYDLPPLSMIPMNLLMASGVSLPTGTLESHRVVLQGAAWLTWV